MKKTALVLVTLLLLILDWLALDDITTNPQPSYLWEYTMLIISVVVLGGISYLVYKKKIII